VETANQRRQQSGDVVIPEAAVKSLARRQSVDAMVVDRDHALGVVLWALTPDIGSAGWVFKGGTCLRKCYFGDYRFSEDLDFTVVARLDEATATAIIANCDSRAAAQGVRLAIQEARVRKMNDDYGRESIEIKVPYRGALRMPGAQNIQFHLSADEELAFDTLELPLIHPYDDAPSLECTVRAYALEEILAEKLRSVSGQRRHAIARDLYDIANVVRRGTNTADALSALPAKAARKGLDLKGVAARFRDWEAEFEANWRRSLAYLIVDDLTFEDAFSTTAELLERL
jgi:predicted nucleotidyltransferase component of viral defense system